MAGGNDLGNVGSVAEAAGEGHLQDLVVRRPYEVVPGADYFGAAAAAEFLETFAGARGGLYLQVGEARTGFDGEGEAPLGVFALACAAGGYERGVGGAEQLLYVLVAEPAAVQADLRHLHVFAPEDLRNLVEVLILYASANHILLPFLSS